jgi:hypothetical protein
MPDPKTLKSPNGDALSLEAFTQTTEALMRQALRKAVAASEGGRLAIDWDTLTFP